MRMLPSGEVVPAPKQLHKPPSRRVTLSNAAAPLVAVDQGASGPQRRVRRTASVLDSFAGLLRSKDPEPSRLSTPTSSAPVVDTGAAIFQLPAA